MEEKCYEQSPWHVGEVLITTDNKARHGTAVLASQCRIGISRAKPPHCTLLHAHKISAQFVYIKR